MLLFSSLGVLFWAPVIAAGRTDTFYESLTLAPLPDGKLSILFEFTTHFTTPHSAQAIPQSHHTLTPPALLLPLQHNNLSELTVSFVSGRWDQSRSSQSGPLHYSSSGGGGGVRGWVRDGDGDSEARWAAVTHALGGLFCAGLGPKEDGENVKTFGDIYPPQSGDVSDKTHYFLSHPHHNLCTENLTPFLSLLPSKGLSGLSSLLAQPGIIFSWGFKSEGIEVIMPSENEPEGRWTGWWEGVVDLIPPGAGTKPVKRDASLYKLFSKYIPRPFPEAASSVVRLVMPVGENVNVEPQGEMLGEWRDGRWRDVVEWDLRDRDLVGKDIKIWWDEQKFIYPRTIPPPSTTILKTVIDSEASDGTFQIKITNNGNISREAVYSEIWPWWVKGWISEMDVQLEGEVDLLRGTSYNPSTPPIISTTTLHFFLSLPPHSTVILTIPFTKLTLKYNDHRPDAERGQEIPSGILTFLDLVGESSLDTLEASLEEDPRRSNRAHIHTPRILLDIPTPDFSMPYNVIIMTSTVMAVFFGLMQGALTRRWGWIEVPKEEKDVKTE